jgi:hypothetical protein
MKKGLTTEQLLVRAGLRPTDGRVYAALGTRDANVTEIGRAAKLHRPAVYRSLERLLAKKIVLRGTKGKRDVYRRGPVAVLRAFLKGAERETERALRSIAVPGIPSDAGVQVLTGKDGISSVLDLMMREMKRNQIFYRYSSRPVDMDIEKYVPPTYRRTRDAKRIQQFVIVNERLKYSIYKKRVDAVSRMIPAKEDRFEYGVNVLIFGDKVAFVNFSEERAYIITDKKIADLQRGIFRALYSRLKD